MLEGFSLYVHFVFLFQTGLKELGVEVGRYEES